MLRNFKKLLEEKKQITAKKPLVKMTCLMRSQMVIYLLRFLQINNVHASGVNLGATRFLFVDVAQPWPLPAILSIRASAIARNRPFAPVAAPREKAVVRLTVTGYRD